MKRNEMNYSLNWWNWTNWCTFQERQQTFRGFLGPENNSDEATEIHCNWKTLHRMFQWYLLLTAKCHPHYKRQSIWGSRITTRICSKIESTKLQSCKITPKQSSYSAFYLSVRHHPHHHHHGAKMRKCQQAWGCLRLPQESLVASTYQRNSWLMPLSVAKRQNTPFLSRKVGSEILEYTPHTSWYYPHATPPETQEAPGGGIEMGAGMESIGDHCVVQWQSQYGLVRRPLVTIDTGRRPPCCAPMWTPWHPLTPPSACRVNMRILVHHGHSSSTSPIR